MGSILMQVFHWVLVSSIKAGILVVLILLIKALVKNKLDARWHYAIWTLLFLQLVLPWTPSSPVSIYKLIPTNYVKAILPTELGQSLNTELPKPSIITKSSTLTSSPDQISQDVNNTPPGSGLPHTGPVVPLWELVEWLWLAGVALFVLRIGIAENRFRKRLKKSIQVHDPHLLAVLEDCKQLAGVSKAITLKETDALKSPALFGVFRPQMLLPTGLASKLTSEQLVHVFLHELVHYTRHDIAVNWIATVLRVAHWFNPLAWYGFKRLQDDQELSCDALAISYLKPEAVQEYGRTLIRVLEFAGPQPSQLISTAGISGGKSLSKRRIMMITLFKKPSFKWSLLGVLAIIVVAFVAMTFPKVNDTVAKPDASSAKTNQTDTSPATKPGADTGAKQELIVYRNTEYGFSFSLPASWKSYTIITDKWEGLPLGGDKVVESGPMISIRHPEWTLQNQRQDIPIMIFTLDQWNSLQQEKFHIGAAPIGPSELGRNASYVFALPARYNYAFPTGYEEVEQILNNKPLQALDSTVLEQPGGKNTAAILADYFPLSKGSTWDYEGTGNEYAAFTREVLFTEGDLAQIMDSNGGTVTSRVIQTTSNAILEIFSQAESYDRINMLHEKANEQKTIFKSPLDVGTKWNEGNSQKEIVDTAAIVETPAGTFKDCIKVKITSSGNDSIVYEYYAKGVGLVERDFFSGGDKISSSLKSYHLAK
ncbi:MAG: M56 family metallopeptidase [Bacillota bacterium]